MHFCGYSKEERENLLPSQVQVLGKLCEPGHPWETPAGGWMCLLDGLVTYRCRVRMDLTRLPPLCSHHLDSLAQSSGSDNHQGFSGSKFEPMLWGTQAS